MRIENLKMKKNTGYSVVKNYKERIVNEKVD